MIPFAETLEFIKVAHAGQKYGDDEYWKHPLEVALTADEHFGSDPVMLNAALLHDVVEDTDYDLIYIENVFGTEVAEVVDLLTKDNKLTYVENIQRIIDSDNLVAMKVKLSDNMVNLRGDKSHMNPKRAQKLRDRYTRSIQMLMPEILARDVPHV